MSMSWGRLSTRPLAPEDDWFVEPDVGPSAGQEEPGERRTSDPEPREGATGPPKPRGAKGLGGERSRKLVAAAVIGAILFIGGALVGTLAARALSGGDETTTSTLTRTTTVTTTSPTTTPTTTTPTTSTPAALPQGVVLRRGDEGGDVSEVQAALVDSVTQQAAWTESSARRRRRPSATSNSPPASSRTASSARRRSLRSQPH